jgi:hypothetical protein
MTNKGKVYVLGNAVAVLFKNQIENDEFIVSYNHD